MRLNIVRDLVKQLTGQQTTSKQVTSPRWVDTWARDMVTGYWSVHILFWQLSIDHIVNVLFHKKCGLAETRLRHPSLPLITSPTPPIESVDAYVRTYARSIMWEPDEKRLTIFLEYGALSHARFARAGAPLIIKSKAHKWFRTEFKTNCYRRNSLTRRASLSW